MRSLFLVASCLAALGTCRFAVPNTQETFEVPTFLNDTEIDLATGKKSVGYYPNWVHSTQKYPPSLIQADILTHVIYAFADISATGEVVLSDSWADKEMHYPGDHNENGNNLYGNFKQLYLIKKAHRHLKVMLSIGGWGLAPKYHSVVVSPGRRANFVQSSVRLLEDYGLDGLDLDYEFPQNNAQASGFASLLKELRSALDAHAQSKNANYRFLLSIATSCGPDNYQILHVKDMDVSLDFWNLMAYDISGPWDTGANHQANLFGGAVSGSKAVQWYISQGVAPIKIVLGIPLYGRSFWNTAGLGKHFSGVGPGSWSPGLYDYRALPLQGSHVFDDSNAGASWSYDSNKRELISFDDEQVGTWKGNYIKDQGLRGSMFWDLSGDKGSGQRNGIETGEGKDEKPGRSLVRVVMEAMGPLSQSNNWLTYEGSQYDNMKKGMA